RTAMGLRLRSIVHRAVPPPWFLGTSPDRGESGSACAARADDQTATAARRRKGVMKDARDKQPMAARVARPAMHDAYPYFPQPAIARPSKPHQRICIYWCTAAKVLSLVAGISNLVVTLQVCKGDSICDRGDFWHMRRRDAAQRGVERHE